MERLTLVPGSEVAGFVVIPRVIILDKGRVLKPGENIGSSRFNPQVTIHHSDTRGLLLQTGAHRLCV